MSRCHVCRVNTPKRCSQCRSVHYCSKACQHQDWHRHRPQCGPKKNCFCRYGSLLNSSVLSEYSSILSDVPTPSLKQFRDRLCLTCANSMHDGRPIFFHLLRQGIPLSTAFWEVWDEAGANMCFRARAHVPRPTTLLEASLQALYSMLESCSRLDIDNFHSLVKFFLARYPDVVFTAQLPARLFLPDRDVLRTTLQTFWSSAARALNCVLPVAVLVPIVTGYAYPVPSMIQPVEYDDWPPMFITVGTLFDYDEQFATI